MRTPRDVWAALAAAPTNRQIPGTGVAALLGLVVGLAAAAVTTATGANLDYADALSHLTIARRITDAAHAGLDQLGTTWLPMPHLAMAPLAMITTLWTTGWAAALVGAGCLAATCAALYRISARIGLGRAGRLITLLALLINPSLLYAFTTALTEPFLIAALLCCVAGLARWATATRTPSNGELVVFAGLPAAIGVLSRYEAWALVVAGAAFVVVEQTRRRRGWRSALTRAAAFVSAPAVAVLWWLAYNWLEFGSPVEFATGQYSAKAQQAVLEAHGILPTAHHLGLSVVTYDWALIETAGAVLIGLAVLGAVALLLRFRLRTPTAVVGLLAVPYVFSVFSLYLGQTAIDNDHTTPTGWWNNRFALSVCPLLALLTGVLTDAVRGRWRAVISVIAVAGLAGQAAWFAQDLDHRSAVLAEAWVSHRDAGGALDAARWLSAHDDGSTVLIDESARYNEVLPILGIPLRHVLMRADGAAFTDALADPAAHARWLFVDLPGRNTNLDSGVSDAVAQALQRPAVAARYRMVFSAGDHGVFERVGG